MREAWHHHRRCVLTHLPPSVVLELDPAGSCKPLFYEPEKEHGQSCLPPRSLSDRVSSQSSLSTPTYPSRQHRAVVDLGNHRPCRRSVVISGRPLPRASPRRQPASKLSAAARRARHRHREAEWHWPESRHLAPQATSDAQHRAIGENEDFDLAAVLARRLTSSTIPMSRHNGSMQHLFNRSRSRPSWVMQGSAPRASERARGCQRHRRECSYRDPGCHTAIGPCRSRRRHRPRGRQRHRRECSHRDSRCPTAIGPCRSRRHRRPRGRQRHRRECSHRDSRCPTAI